MNTYDQGIVINNKNSRNGLYCVFFFAKSQSVYWLLCVDLLVQLISHWRSDSSMCSYVRQYIALNILMAFYFKHILCIVNSMDIKSHGHSQYSIWFSTYLRLHFSLVLSFRSSLYSNFGSRASFLTKCHFLFIQDYLMLLFWWITMNEISLNIYVFVHGIIER